MMQADAANAAAQAGEAAAGAGTAAQAQPSSNDVLSFYETMASRLSQEEGSFWLPESLANTADKPDFAFYFVYFLSVICFIGITAAVVYFVMKYRARPGNERALPSPTHNNVIEVIWTVVPALITVVLFVIGWRGYIENATPPRKSLEIQVRGAKWNWEFTHENGVKDKALHVPVDTPVRLVMTSNDVIHSFFIPGFRVKQDVLPRRYTQIWFKATKPGVYRVYCTEYCGTSHSQMKTTVVVHEPGGYAKYLQEMQKALDNVPPEERGKRIYNAYCVSCHTLDGTLRVGPSFKGIWGAEHEMEGGAKVVVDENYVRESILTPQVKIRKGYPGSMTPFQGILKDSDIEGVIAYLKTLK